MPLRNVFLSHHHHGDAREVQTFFDQVDGQACHCRMVDVSDAPIDSYDYDYVMRVIREQHLANTSVTIVMVGRCTWARKYVDWEIASTLRDDLVNRRSGLMGICLPSISHLPEATLRNLLPPRLADNLNTGYAKVYRYPQSICELQGWIDDAFNARTGRAHLVENRAELFVNNRTCQ